MTPDLKTFGDAASVRQTPPNPNEAKFSAVVSAIFSNNTELAMQMRLNPAELTSSDIKVGGTDAKTMNYDPTWA